MGFYRQKSDTNKGLTTCESISCDLDTYISKRKLCFFLKRAFDIIVSLLGILLLLPVYIIIAVCVIVSSKGGVFFRQVRVGRFGKEFKIFKFRTMINDAQFLGPQITISGDGRITNIGHFLRKTKLDELPQLFNVFWGDMSFVGPRPEVPKYVNMYSSEQRKILLIRPGITDLASIRYRNESEILAASIDPEKFYVEEIMHEKIRLNLEYLQDISLKRDIHIIFTTLLKVIRPADLFPEVANDR